MWDLKRIIWLGRVAGLDGVRSGADNAVSIGATVTLEDAAPLLGAIHPDLRELLRRFGCYKFVWHANLVRVALFIITYGLLFGLEYE